MYKGGQKFKTASHKGPISYNTKDKNRSRINNNIDDP